MFLFSIGAKYLNKVSLNRSQQQLAFFFYSMSCEAYLSKLAPRFPISLATPMLFFSFYCTCRIMGSSSLILCCMPGERRGQMKG